ncbi:hypothetical protein Tco_1109412 [Tanacetum coccineum]
MRSKELKTWSLHFGVPSSMCMTKMLKRESSTEVKGTNYGTDLSVKKLHGYGHLEEIVVKRSDQQFYKFKEGDFVDLHLNDIEDEKEVSDDEELTQVNVLMSLVDDELAVRKNHARNGEWINITMRKVNILLSMDEDVDWQNYLKYINIDLKFVEAADGYAYPGVSNQRDGIDIGVDVVHPVPVVVVAFPTVTIVMTLARYGEAIRGIHEHLQGVPIEEDMCTLRFRLGMAEEENASLRGKIRITEAIETVTRIQERRARMKMER